MSEWKRVEKREMKKCDGMKKKEEREEWEVEEKDERCKNKKRWRSVEGER